MIQQEQSEKSIFLAAIEISSVAERATFLDRACSGNQPLRAKVEALLQAHEKPQRLLDNPPESTPILDEMQLLERPGTVIGPYKLLERLGEGGFGVVYMAEQQQPLRRTVALKVIKPGMDSKQVIARFEAEQQALALMDHPHIAHVLDAGTTDTGRLYFVMELIRGIPITQFCDDNRLTLRVRLELFLAVCQAVQHAHQKRIIHRDLKPSNVLVTLLDGTPIVKVIDFGIAKALGHERLTEKTLCTGFAQLMGTPLYMSPEQAEMSGQDVDTRTDIYGLGVLLYELLTGTTPFDKERLKEASYDELRRIIREEEPAKPSTRISTLGQAATTVSANRQSEPRRLSQLFRGELDWIVMKALEKDCNHRYDTASIFAADVQHYLDGEPVQASPPSASYRLRKFARKYQMPVIVAAGFVLLLMVGVAVSTWQAVRATDAEHAATRKRQEAESAREQARTAEANSRRLYYAANMGLVQAAWDNHNILQLQMLLAETEAFPERGFEWYYWQRLCRVEHLTLGGHKGGVNAVAFAPDGKRLVTAVTDGTARLWDATSGQELFCLQGHRSGVTAVAYAPDGQWLVTGSTDSTARVWDAAGGRELWTFQNQNTGSVWAVAVTPDSKRVITGNEDGTATVWDAISRQKLLTLQGHTGQIWAIAVTPDGKQVVTGSEDHTARVWDAAKGESLLTLSGHAAPVWAVAVTPDGKRVVTGSGDSRTKIWDADSGTELLTLPGGGGDLLSLTISQDGQRLITGYWGGGVIVWDLASGQKILTLTGHRLWVTCVAVSPDGQRVATGSLDGTARVWDTASGRGTWPLKGLTDTIMPVAVTSGGQRLVTGSRDGTVRVWDAVSRRVLLSLKGDTGTVRSVAVTPDGQRIVTGSDDGAATVWDMVSGHKLLSLKGDTGTVRSVAVTPDGQRIVTRSWDGTARVWGAAKGELLQTLKWHTSPVLTGPVTPDGQRIVTESRDGTATVWDTVSGRELLKLDGQHTDRIQCVTITPDGQRLVTGSDDGTAAFWDAVSGRELLSLKGHTGPVRSVAVTPDGRRLITQSDDGTVKIWEAAAPEQVALWTKQEQEAARRLAAWQRPVAGAPGFIQDWLVLAPLALEAGETGAKGLEREQLKEEANLQPRAGDTVWVDGQERAWRAQRGDEPLLDFNDYVGRLCRDSVAYAICYVISAAERSDLLLQVGSDDQAKVYLNGQEIYKYSRERALLSLDPVGPVSLRKGTNVLVFKVVNGNSDWLGCLRFVDPEGNPPVGLQVSLTPQ